MLTDAIAGQQRELFPLQIMGQLSVFFFEFWLCRWVLLIKSIELGFGCPLSRHTSMYWMTIEWPLNDYGWPLGKSYSNSTAVKQQGFLVTEARAGMNQIEAMWHKHCLYICFAARWECTGSLMVDPRIVFIFIFFVTYCFFSSCFRHADFRWIQAQSDTLPSKLTHGLFKQHPETGVK